MTTYVLVNSWVQRGQQVQHCSQCKLELKLHSGYSSERYTLFSQSVYTKLGQQLQLNSATICLYKDHQLAAAEYRTSDNMFSTNNVTIQHKTY